MPRQNRSKMRLFLLLGIFCIIPCFFLPILTSEKEKLLLVENEGRILKSTQYSAIFINGNDEMEAFPNKTGSGTTEDPYIIENLIINVNGEEDAMALLNIDKPLLVRNCTFSGADSSEFWNQRGSAGLYCFNVENLNISNCVSRLNFYGMFITSSVNIAINSCNISNNFFAIHLYNSFHSIFTANDITNTSYRGFNVYSSDNNSFYSNNFHSSGGLRFENSDNNYIYSNNAHFNNRGFYIFGSTNNTFVLNNASNNQYGDIVIQDSRNMTLERNYGSIQISGTVLADYSTHDISVTNIAAGGKPVYYYKDRCGLSVENFTNAGQVILVNCSFSEVSNLNVSGGSTGILLAYSSNINISGNDASR
ncbi:MAG: right-handed parallel beta-helix repeat-containing protein, partial [Candidatus Hodarchaeota archaeon]